MNGLTIKQYVEQLKLWNVGIEQKQKFLNRGFKVYQFIYFFVTTISNISNFIAAFLSSIVVGYSTQDSSSNLVTILSAISASFSIIAIICSAVDIVFKPQATAEQASFSSKCYAELFREISVEIISCMNSGGSAVDADANPSQDQDQDSDLMVSFEKYKSKLLYYSSREQIISVNEPGLILIGYKNKNITTDLALCKSKVSIEDLEFLSSLVDTIDDEAMQNRLEKILYEGFDVKTPRNRLNSDEIEIPI
jgi:hypothetical protein